MAGRGFLEAWARALCAPLHRHTREDAYSYVLTGRVGALLGDDVLVSGPGDLIFKPRNQWHTFWNAGDEPARILEIISLEGFEKYFAKLVELGGSRNASPEALRTMTLALENAKVLIPRSNRLPVLVRHDSRNLMQVCQVMRRPRRQ
jgi:gentisate 1,2-dioxygenase